MEFVYDFLKLSMKPILAVTITLLMSVNVVLGTELDLASEVSGRAWRSNDGTNNGADPYYLEAYYPRQYVDGYDWAIKKSGIAEFDISSIPTGSKINSIQLSIVTKFNNTAGEIDVKGYSGNGMLDITDFGSGHVSLGTFVPNSTAGSTNDVSLSTNKLQELINNGEQFFGLEFEQIGVLASGAQSIGASFNSELVLTIDFIEPDTITSTVSGRAWGSNDGTNNGADPYYLEAYYSRQYVDGYDWAIKKSGIAEFDISSIPTGSKINSIQLSIVTKFNNTAGEIDVKGYSGNGMLDTTDFGSGHVSLGTFVPNSTAGSTNDVSLSTNKLQELINNGEQFFGLEFEQIGVLPSGAQSIGASFNSEPVLIISVSAPLNQPPTAEAGVNQSAHIGETIYLDGSSSYDDINATEELSFTWVISEYPTGSSALIVNADNVNPHFILDQEGDYKISLSVTDQSGLTGIDTITVSSFNTPPTAEAEQSIISYVGSTVLFDGSKSSDPDGDTISYSWSLINFPGIDDGIQQIEELVGSDTATPSLYVDRVGDYVLRLIVSDEYSESTPSEVTAIVISVDDYTTNEILGAIDDIYKLTSEEVSRKGNRRALAYFAKSAVIAIQKDHIKLAIHKLNRALNRVDGCILRGTPDRASTGEVKDFVLSCDEQVSIYTSLSNALKALRAD